MLACPALASLGRSTSASFTRYAKWVAGKCKSRSLYERENILSWGITIFKAPSSFASVAEIPDQYQPESLGSRAEVIDQIQKVFPTADFSDPEWGSYEEDAFVLEFIMGSNKLCSTFGIRAHGQPVAIAAINHLLQNLGLRGVDHQTSEFFTLPSGTQSYENWRAFKIQATKQE
jgi:hypothetical protein